MSCNETFWQMKIGDAASLLIALFNIFLAYYIFVYQRKKDKDDRASMTRQIRQNVRLDWLKLLIIEPHVDTIHSFFRTIEDILQPMRKGYLSSEEKNRIINDLGQKFNQFDSQVISLLFVADDNFGKINQDLLDKLRDGLTESIDKFETSSTQPPSNVPLPPSLRKCHNNLLSNIYNFGLLDRDNSKTHADYTRKQPLR
jgi:hypothetical protein